MGCRPLSVVCRGCSGKDFTSTCWRNGFPASRPAQAAPAAGDQVFLVQNGSIPLPIHFANLPTPALPTDTWLRQSGEVSETATLLLERNTLHTGPTKLGVSGQGAPQEDERIVRLMRAIPTDRRAAFRQSCG